MKARRGCSVGCTYGNLQGQMKRLAGMEGCVRHMRTGDLGRMGLAAAARMARAIASAEPEDAGGDCSFAFIAAMSASMAGCGRSSATAEGNITVADIRFVDLGGRSAILAHSARALLS